MATMVPIGENRTLTPDASRYSRNPRSGGGSYGPVYLKYPRAHFCVALRRTDGEFSVGITGSAVNDDNGEFAAEHWRTDATDGSSAQMILTGNVPRRGPVFVPTLPDPPVLVRPNESDEPRFGVHGSRISYEEILPNRDYENLFITPGASSSNTKTTAWVRLRLEPGEIYRIYPRGAALGGGTLKDVRIDLYTHKVCTTDTIYTPKNGSPENVGCSGVKFAGNDHLAVNHRISTAHVALSETGDLAHGAVSDTDLAYVEFKTPCIKGSTGCADNQALDSLDRNSSRLMGRERLAKQIPCLAAPLQEAIWPVDPHKSEQLPWTCQPTITSGSGDIIKMPEKPEHSASGLTCGPRLPLTMKLSKVRAVYSQISRGWPRRMMRSTTVLWKCGMTGTW